MATQDHPEEETPVVESSGTAPESESEDFRPSGAFRFVLLLIVAYVIYFFVTWHEIVILRGGA